ncbi:rod shape-determining protein RodA [Candidatus Levibacter sp. Uisw_134_01]|uniref:rod shape-determining protein RodA n=1 Tax=Candidatus Levibacter sp. Uisw_134_01 TaxID=3230999 RepID=UPI003D4FC2D3
MNYKSNKFSTDNPTNILLTKFLKINWVMVLCVVFLGLVGVAALYSAAGGNWNPWAKSHLIRLIIGVFLMFIITFIHPKFFYKLTLISFLLGLLSLVFVKFFGVGSVQRWITIGGLNVQPSELMKFALILMLARYFDQLSKINFNRLFSYVIPILYIIIPGLIVISQPDLGTGLTIIILGFAILFYVGVSLKFVFIFLLTFISSVPIIWQQLYNYQKNRILVFLNPEIDSLGSGYQIIQSKIAIGSGGLFGKGYLLGSQSRLNYLPEKHTDFIFTLISEELGFFGAMTIILIFCVLIASIVKISFTVDTLFSKVIVFGVGLLIFLYLTLNIGMVCGLLPVVGAPLPLISYGGTSLFTILISVGVVLSINVHKNEA